LLSYLTPYTTISTHFTLPLHDALPICTFVVSHYLPTRRSSDLTGGVQPPVLPGFAHAEEPEPHQPSGERRAVGPGQQRPAADLRSEEHTSELQSRENLVCRLLLEKKNPVNLIQRHLSVVSGHHSSFGYVQKGHLPCTPKADGGVEHNTVQPVHEFRIPRKNG